MRFQVLYHDRCFDGAASAALFGKFLEDHHGPGASVSYRGVSHAANFTWKPQQFEGDEIAILDFRYCPHPCVRWWFDHHQSAFLSAADEQHFRRCASGQMVLDTTYSSCARLVADSLGRTLGYHAPRLEQLVDWADIVDGAKYPNARVAVDIASR